MRIILFSISILFCLNVVAQTLTNPMDILKQKREVIYGLDNRRTHINKHQTVIYGLYTGLSFGKNFRLKLGVSGTPFEIGKFVDTNGVLKRNRLLFINVGEEYDFLTYKRFSMTSYLQAGIGSNFYRELNSFGTEINRNSRLIIPIETGLHFGYNLNKYLKLKTGFGWRFVVPNESKDLSGYYIKLGLSFNIKNFKILKEEIKTRTHKLHS